MGTVPSHYSKGYPYFRVPTLTYQAAKSSGAATDEAFTE
jgi:hypothetical protein